MQWRQAQIRLTNSILSVPEEVNSNVAVVLSGFLQQSSSAALARLKQVSNQYGDDSLVKVITRNNKVIRGLIEDSFSGVSFLSQSMDFLVRVSRNASALVRRAEVPNFQRLGLAISKVVDETASLVSVETVVGDPPLKLVSRQASLLVARNWGSNLSEVQSNDDDGGFKLPTSLRLSIPSNVIEADSAGVNLVYFVSDVNLFVFEEVNQTTSKVKLTTRIASTFASLSLNRGLGDTLPISGLAEPITFNISMKDDALEPGKRVCRFWNHSTASWSADGCQMNALLSSQTHTICQCNHLTDFAVSLDDLGPQVREIEVRCLE